MQIKVTLDENVHADIILALEKMANGGALPKVLIRVICEWFLMRPHFGTIQAQGGTIQARIEPESQDAEPDDLAAAIANIEGDW